MLMTRLSGYQFVVCTIAAQKKDRGKYNYRLPDNVAEIEEIFLDEAVSGKARWGKRIGITNAEKEALACLLFGADAGEDAMATLAKGCGANSAHEFVSSADFLDLAKELYEERYPHLPFVDFYWNLRSMVSPLYHIIRAGVPKADLYHSVSAGYAGVLGSLGKSLHGRPFVLTEHGIYTREREEEIIKSEWIRGRFKDIWVEHFYSLSRYAYSHADKVVSLFDRNRKIQIGLGCEPEKIDIIPNGVRAERFADLPPKDDPKDRLNVGAIVRVVPIKDIVTMIEGFAAAKKALGNVKFHIMGPLDEDEGYASECRALALRLGLSDLEFTGRVNVIEHIGKMDVLVLTSISEGQPLAILEGMASGKPFVATDVGSCGELLHGNRDGYGDAGVTLPVMDARRLGEAIVTLCNDKDTRERMGRNGRNRVAGLYSEEMLLSSYRRLYNDLGSWSDGRDRV